MKTKAMIIMISLVLLVVQFGMAQQKEAQANRRTVMSTSGTSGSGEVMSGTALQNNDLNLEGDAGSLYVGTDWPLGILTLRGGKMIENYRFRYDVYADQMQFIAGPDTLAFASPSELYTVAFGEKTFVYEPFECSGALMKGYFQLIVPGKKQLLLKRTVMYHLNEEKGTVDEQQTYLVSECYFIKSGNQPAHKVMCSKKNALVAMEDRKNELEEYLRQTGNKVKTPDDLKKMVEYYNSLE
ncbi:MAG: hypothetical protein IPH88_05660 [Bacteroidales bacterium]|nr:hypothetical protein [Bacteroidales bacterium]